MSIGSNIKAARKAKGITQKELSKKINKTFSSVQKYELDIIQPPVDVIRDIAGVLDCTPAYLMGWEEDYEFRDVPPGEPDNLEVTKKWFALKQKSRLDEAYNKLNQTGQKEAVKRVEELMQIDKYKLSNDPDKE